VTVAKYRQINRKLVRSHLIRVALSKANQLITVVPSHQLINKQLYHRHNLILINKQPLLITTDQMLPHKTHHQIVILVVQILVLVNNHRQVTLVLVMPQIVNRRMLHLNLKT
jgi:hypothetical protein